MMQGDSIDLVAHKNGFNDTLRGNSEQSFVCSDILGIVGFNRKGSNLVILIHALNLRCVRIGLILCENRECQAYQQNRNKHLHNTRKIIRNTQNAPDVFIVCKKLPKYLFIFFGHQGNFASGHLLWQGKSAKNKGRASGRHE